VGASIEIKHRQGRSREVVGSN